MFGFIDVGVFSPPNDQSVFALTVNSRLMAGSKTLLSPGGRVQNRGSTTCADGYTGCVGVQGTDTLEGSSGGAVFTTSDTMAYGVLNGSRTLGATGRTPKCHTGFLCWPNKELIARFSSKVFTDQFWDVSSSLSAVSSITYTAFAGSQSGHYLNQSCGAQEAMTGFVGSRVGPVGLSSLGTLGSVCSPLNGGLLAGAYGFWTHGFVQTTGARDTRFISTPIFSSADRVSLNRYIRTVWTSRTLAPVSSTMEPLSVLRCPSGMAVYAVSTRLKDNEVHAITSIGCRGIVGEDVEISIDRSQLGDSISTTHKRLECGADRIAFGHAQRVDERVTDLRLNCRSR